MVLNAVYKFIVKNTGVKILNLCCYFDCFIREGWMLSCRVAQTGEIWKTFNGNMHLQY